MKSFYQVLPILLLAVFAIVAERSNAQAKDGEYTVTQGNTVTVAISAAYSKTLQKATGVSATWTTGNSSIAIQSRTNTTCTIKGISPVSNARLNYHCSYYIDGYYRTMDFYYDITVKSNVVTVTNIQISPSSANMEIGERLQLTATAYPTNATNRSLNWSTENGNIASVSSNGLVTAHGVGKVWVWAKATDGSGAGNYCVITVSEPSDITSVELSENRQAMSYSGSAHLYVSATNNTIYVNGLPQDEIVNVYNLRGVLVKSTTDSVVTLDNSGVYIIRIGDKTFKFVL